MNDFSLHEGRFRQKLQTRTEILEAANRLMLHQQKITLEDVSKEAGISRATVYRYFSNIDLLVAEASLDIHHRSPYQLYEDVKDMSLGDRILYLQKYYNEHAQEHELILRRHLCALLTKSITSSDQLREDERIKSLTKALEPFKRQISEDDFEKLIKVSAVLMGIDALIICKDICGLNNQESDSALRWGIQMILKGISANDITD